MTILVTAALGNVGREVVTSCRAMGLAVRAAHRDEAEARAQLANVEVARFDFLDRATWVPALGGCDQVFLLRPPPIADMNATLCPFVDAAYAAGVRHVVFLSVMGAERMSWVPHRKVEDHLRASGRSWTILRPGFFAQNLKDAYFRDIVEDDRLYLPAGDGVVAFLDARDIGAVAAHVLANPESHAGAALTLTGPRAIGFAEVADILSRELGRPIGYRAATIPGYAWHLRRRRSMPWGQIAIQTVLHVGLRKGDAATVDPTLERLLGRPGRDLVTYVRDHADVWRAPSARFAPQSSRG